MRRTLSLLCLALSVCVSGCSLHRSSTVGETAITHQSVVASAADTRQCAEDSSSVRGSATAVVAYEHAVIDSTDTTTDITWGVCPDGVVRPLSIHTSSTHHGRENESRSSHEESSTLSHDTTMQSESSTTISSSRDDTLGHWEQREQAHTCAGSRSLWTDIKRIFLAAAILAAAILIYRLVITIRRLR